MPIAKTIHRWTRIVPVRFARAPDANNANAASGGFDPNAPEPDTRGFMPVANGSADLPVGLDESVAEAARPESRVKLIRRDVEAAARLHVTSSAPAVLEITSPAAGAALPNQQNAIVKFRAKTAGESFLEVRFDSTGGQIIHRLRVVVSALRDVRVAAHLPTINRANAATPIQNDTSGTVVPPQSTRTDAAIRDLFDEVNEIYFPYGLRFVLDAPIDRAGALNFHNQGMVNDLSNELTQLFAHNRVNHAINAYFVPQIAAPHEVGNNHTPADSVGGVAMSAHRNPGTFGLAIADWHTGGQTISHEIGHVLNLINDSRYVHVNTVRDAAHPGTGRQVRDDIISRRRLMWAYTNLLADANMPYRDDVGYGAGQPGAMLSIKQLDDDRTDDEMAEVQRRAAAI